MRSGITIIKIRPAHERKEYAQERRDREKARRAERRRHKQEQKEML